MRKRLAILIGLAVVLIAAIVLVTCENERSAEHYHQENINKSHPPASAPTRQGNSANQANNSHPEPACWHILLAWPNGITAWAIIATLFVIGWQSWETRQAAKAMQFSNMADIESKRARLVLKHEYEDREVGSRIEREHYIDAVNVGATIAEIFAIRVEFSSMNRKTFAHLDTMTFPDPSTSALHEPFILFPDESRRISSALSHVAVPEQIQRDIASDRLFAIWYGWIDFRDFSGAQRRHRFFCTYSHGNNAFYPFGPTGYNGEQRQNPN